MQAQIKAWGNSQGIRLSREILNAAQVSIDDYLEVTVMDGKIILEKPRRHLTLAERSIPYGGDLDIGEEFDWESPKEARNGDEYRCKSRGYSPGGICLKASSCSKHVLLSWVRGCNGLPYISKRRRGSIT